MGLRAYSFSVEWVEDEQQIPFSVVCSQRTRLYTVNNTYEDDFFFGLICSIDFQPRHWKEQKEFSGGKKTAHKAAQWTKVVLERASLNSAEHRAWASAHAKQAIRYCQTAQ